MEPDDINRERALRTRIDVVLLTAAIAQWLEGWKKWDELGRHRTQREVLQTELLGACEALGADLPSPAPGDATTTVYQRCRAIDQAATWLRQVWQYYREKVDQRQEGGELGQTARAADEVVWSCYRQPFVRAKGRDPNVRLGAPPLAYVAPDDTPRALKAGGDPSSLVMREAWPDSLQAYLRTIPVPLVRLPAGCVASPWRLVSIGHEVGHHVQNDLRLVSHFNGGLKAAAHSAGLAEADQERWGAWGEEVFADFYSVLVHGPAAVVAAADALWRSAAGLLTRGADYPSPLCRLTLMNRAAAALGMGEPLSETGYDLSAPPRLAAADPAARPAVRGWEQDQKAIDGAVAFALAPLRDGLGTLPQLCVATDPYQFPGEEVAKWGDCLRGKADRADSKYRALEAPRLVTSAAVLTWGAESRQAADAEFVERREGLAKKVRETLRASGPRETRSKVVPDGEAEGRLGRLLLEAGREASA